MNPDPARDPGASLNDAELDRILSEQGRGAEDVVAVLQAIQARCHYLPDAALRYVCAHSAITPAAIVGVASFYSQFRRQPAGRHTVSVCVGTACHVKGGSDIVKVLEKELGVKVAGTTADRFYT